ncbi:MAG: glycoside hydrolase family 9 protein [Spirochaetales bacterium]|nr:glycoside hydrolase family 9 protein [Spirochaetales bacterium]
MKQKICSISIIILLYISVAGSAQSTVNFAEALQKSLYFYDAGKSGPGITGGRLEWRADSELTDQWVPLVSKPTGTHENGVVLSRSFIDTYRSILDPDGDGGVDVSGGMHDAGDHVKFGLPQGYTAGTLLWGIYEFEQAFIDIGEYDHMIDICKWFTDYFLRSAFFDNSGNLIAFCYQVGEGDTDHSYWGVPELQDVEKYPRPAYFATTETPASDQCADVATALTIMSFVYERIDSGYAARCLDTAIALYDFAVAHRGLGYAGSFYQSMYDEDELSWAAVWLYEATGDMRYIDDISATDSQGYYTGYMSRLISDPGDTWQNIWVHCWDAVWGGTFVKLAILFPENENFDYFARWNIEFWSNGMVPHEDPYDSSYVLYTPGGYGMLNTWGSARYNCAAQLCGLIYGKHRNRTDIADWSRNQMTYIMGNNPMGRSYIVGYSDNYAEHPHHRAAHGSTTNNLLDPPNHRHILWGALVGGPDSSDNHNDATDDYIYNEVAIDYNAGLVGALAGLYDYFGRAENHQPLTNFPPPEEITGEHYLRAKIEQENNERTQGTVQVFGQLFVPPFYETRLMCRYFFDISELVDMGQSISNVSTDVMYDEADFRFDTPALLSNPLPWDEVNNIYYVEIDWTGIDIYGTMEYQFALIVDQAPDWKSYWDASNDYSRQGLTNTYAATDYIALYLDGELISGIEPPGSGATAQPTPEPTQIPGSAAGDVNEDGSIDIIDALLVARDYVGLHPENYNPEAADTNCDGNIDIVDALLIAQYYVGLLSVFC